MNTASFTDMVALRRKKWYVAVLELAACYDALDAEHPLDLDGEEVETDLKEFGANIRRLEGRHKEADTEKEEWTNALQAAALCFRYALQKQDYITGKEKPQGRIK